MARRSAEHVLAAGLVLLLLGPVLRPGYVLAYDMVATPEVPFTAASLGWGDGLPRAVPQDAVLAVLTTVVPGWVVQLVALAAVVWLAVVGAARLVPSDRLLVRLVAGAAYGWNAFVAERLLIGHWGLLLGYAALPWIVRAARAARTGAPAAPVVGWAALAALTPTGGLLAAVTASVILCWPSKRSSDAGQGDAEQGDAEQGDAERGEPRTRPRPGWALAVAALNAPWVVAGAVARVSAVSDPDGVAAFAARAENWSGTLGALLGLGGVWNAEVVPASRTVVVAPLFTLLVLVIAAVGFGRLARAWGRGPTTALAVVAAAALLVAVFGALPGGAHALGVLVEHVPGSGLLRDGQKFLAPYALLLALCFALGVERLTDALRTRGARTAAVAATVAALVYPVLVLPDLAWGGAGRLVSVRYPADWDRVAATLAADPRGEMAVLPFSTFRAFGWNGNRTALDPAPRYFPVDVVVEDALPVDTGGGDGIVGGESSRAAEVRDALAGGRSLTTAGIRWVLVERGTPGPVPASALTGYRPVWTGSDLVLYRAESAPPPPSGSETVRVTAVVGGYAVAIGVLLGALASWAVFRSRSRRSDFRASPSAMR
ncbi:hypothetical protein [Cryptosporangium aurantiacum]|uniref:Membrane protein YfhO n=1 Tax=Cryptosporangium aurantiacum TaxID=134849 RepID=A0A1M7IEA0_9ACTN|nr:hypothetical protein [Cryptosporangium aurantiacum]SHM39005.1 hypothetical protein SAMN05443668_101468 [Cryptosporangium aurantiacum]